MATEVLIINKTVYGKDLLYPGNQAAELFAALIGKKTFTGTDLTNIRALGFRTTVIGYVPPPRAFNPDEYPAGVVFT